MSLGAYLAPRVRLNRRLFGRGSLGSGNGLDLVEAAPGVSLPTVGVAQPATTRGLDWIWLESKFRQFVLPIWFAPPALFLALSAFSTGWIGVDAEIYLRGSAAWIASADPWAAFSVIDDDPSWLYHYSALPTTTILLAPLTYIPEEIGVGILVAASALAAIYIIRRLHMPIYWLMFPPLVEGVLTGNPSIALLALLLTGSPILRAFAPLLKVYAFIPMIGERDRRAIPLAVAGFAMTAVTAPLWISYFGDLASRSSRLMVEAEGGYSGAQSAALFAFGLVAIAGLLVLKDWKTAGWLLVPALWPATQFHYSTMAMPVMHPILAVGLVIHDPRIPVLVIGLYVTWRVLRRRLDGEHQLRMAQEDSTPRARGS